MSPKNVEKQPASRRVLGAAGFGLYFTLLAYLAQRGRVNEDGVLLIWLFVLGSIIGYFCWPAIAASSWPPTLSRSVGAIAIAALFALIMSVLFLLLPGFGTDPSTVGFLFMIGLLAGYLVWPGIERDVLPRRE